MALHLHYFRLDKAGSDSMQLIQLHNPVKDANFKVRRINIQDMLTDQFRAERLSVNCGEAWLNCFIATVQADSVIRMTIH
jgi:hypothetical protein